jgi:nucleotide-binding universal stress UspA family protein
MFKKILVATDGSEPAERALQLAADIGRLYAAEIHVVNVLSKGRVSPELIRLAEVEHLVPPASTPAGGQRPNVPLLMSDAAKKSEVIARAIEAVGEQLLSRAANRVKKQGLTKVTTRLLDGDPAESILDEAKRVEADLIAMGSRGLGNLKGLLLGSVSNRVSQLAPCTCITVK